MEDAKRLSVAQALRGLGLGANLVDVAELLWDAARVEPGHRAVAFNAVLRHTLGKNERCIRRWMDELDARGFIEISRRERNDGAYYYRMADPLARFADHRAQQEAEEQPALGEAPPATLRLHVCPDKMSGQNVRTHDAEAIESQPSLPFFDSARDVRRAGSRARSEETSSFELEELNKLPRPRPEPVPDLKPEPASTIAGSAAAGSVAGAAGCSDETRKLVEGLASHIARSINEHVPTPPPGEPGGPEHNRVQPRLALRLAATTWSWATQQARESGGRLADPVERRKFLDRLFTEAASFALNNLRAGIVKGGLFANWTGVVQNHVLAPRGIEFEWRRQKPRAP